MSSFFFLLHPSLGRTGTFQACCWSIGDVDTFQIFTLLDQPTDSMVQGNSRWLFFCYLCCLKTKLNIVLKPCIFSSRCAENRAYLCMLKLSIPCCVCPIPQHVCICSYDLNFKFLDKAICSVLWKNIQVFILMQNQSQVIWWYFFHFIPSLLKIHMTQNRGNAEKRKAVSSCFTTYLPLIRGLV